MDQLKEKWWAVAIAAFIIGGTLGYAFFPTKSIEEKIRVEESLKRSTAIQKIEEASNARIENINSQLAETQRMAKTYKEETTKKLQSIITENTKLKNKWNKRKFKLIKPDGTVIEKEFEESETDKTSTVVTEVREEFNRKVSSIEKKWKKIHVKRMKQVKEHYEKKLSEKKTEVIVKENIVVKEKKVEINKKKLRTEIGINNDLTPYVHTSYDLWGPFFIGGGISGTQKKFGDVRLGVGFQF